VLLKVNSSVPPPRWAWCTCQRPQLFHKCWLQFLLLGSQSNPSSCAAFDCLANCSLTVTRLGELGSSPLPWESSGIKQKGNWGHNIEALCRTSSKSRAVCPPDSASGLWDFSWSVPRALLQWAKPCGTTNGQDSVCLEREEAWVLPHWLWNRLPLMNEGKEERY
jgi:hypothetical protein